MTNSKVNQLAKQIKAQNVKLHDVDDKGNQYLVSIDGETIACISYFKDVYSVFDMQDGEFETVQTGLVTFTEALAFVLDELAAAAASN